MALSCECDFDYWPEDYGETIWYQPDDFTTLKSKRRKRCVGCNNLIDIGSDCVEITRERTPYDAIEANIKNCSLEDDYLIPVASHYFCFDCGGIYLALVGIGYCVNPYELWDTLEEYHEMTGFKPSP